MSSKKKIVLTIAMIIAFILIIAVGYTFSKYIQEVGGTATAEIAAWSFKANAGSESEKLTDIKLKPRSGTKIAPGTSGEFKIKVDGTGSDVDVTYTTTISQEKLPANMRFNIKGETQTYTTMASLASSRLHGTLDSSNGKEKTYIIEWNWPYKSDTDANIVDSNDMTALSYAGNLGFKIEVTGQQKENN